MFVRTDRANFDRSAGLTESFAILGQKPHSYLRNDVTEISLRVPSRYGIGKGHGFAGGVDRPRSPAKRRRANGASKEGTVPVVTQFATISPMALANLNP